MKVIATAVGYDNLTVRQPGEEFELPDGAKGSWFKAADGDEKGPAKPAKQKATKDDKSDIA